MRGARTARARLGVAEVDLSVADRSAAGPMADRPLLRGVTFEVDAGETVALRGPSGCGKTTLLRCIARLRDPDRGAITLSGRPAEDYGLPVYRRRVVYAAQRPCMVAGTVADNLALPFTFAVADGPFPREEAERLVDDFALAVGLDADAARLSEGERQRVSLARALLVEPEVLLLDEPTSGLDAATRDGVERELVRRREDGAATVLVSHDPDQAERLAQRSVDLERYLA